MSLRKYDILYYIPSTPMGVGVSRDAQPYLYNSKEFVQDHGLNTYDYGFRGYYTVIGRFTTPDPLAEQTPWLSPYSYAGNNFINAIDWMGLSGITYTIPHYIVVDIGGNVKGGVDDDDHNIYVDLLGDWSEEDGTNGLIWVRSMNHDYNWYFNAHGGRRDVVSSGEIINALVNAALNGHLFITMSISFGLEANDKFLSSGDFDYGISGDLMSFELGSITITNLRNNPITHFSYFGKDNRIKISQGFQFANLSYEHSFDVRASDFTYVLRSNTSDFKVTKMPYLSSDGNYRMEASFGIFFSISIEIIYNNSIEGL